MLATFYSISCVRVVHRGEKKSEREAIAGAVYIHIHIYTRGRVTKQSGEPSLLYIYLYLYPHTYRYICRQRRLLPLLLAGTTVAAAPLHICAYICSLLYIYVHNTALGF